MAISIVNGNRGTATEKTSTQTLALTPNGTLAQENYGLLVVVIDNTGAGEGETTDCSAVDSKGNVWVKLREQTESNTTALTGVTVAVFLAKLRYALETTDTVTMNFAVASTAKGAGLAELSVAPGNQLILSTSGANGNNAAAATSYSVALSGLTNVPCLYIGISSAENEVEAAVTLDAAYTGIAFGAIGSGAGGLATSNVIALVGTLANTSTGDTFNVASGLTSSDRATVLVRLEEFTPPFIATPIVNVAAIDTDDAVVHRSLQRRASYRLFPPATLEPPPPPEPPSIPVSPPPFRIGGGSAW